MFEINLVPDVKAEMIRAQKKRNVVFFISVVVSAVAAGLVVILLGIKVGQDVTINGQEDRLKNLSGTIQKYDGLDELLTVQKQLQDLDTISKNKTLLSRVFTVLSSLVEQENGDEIKISSLDVNMESSDISFDGQADAGPNTDGIDYRVLESFTKSVGLMKYDYGRYVDENGNNIPTMCIFETGVSGAPFRDEDGNLYAIWARGVKGCDPSKTVSETSDDEDYLLEDDDETSSSSSSSSSSSTSNSTTVDTLEIENIDLTQPADGVKLVKIFRTPQKEWKDEGGEIKGVPHFESECIDYSRTEKGNWTGTSSCVMAPDGIEVSNSTNGKQTGGKLVLMFSAIIHIDPEVFSFQNKHMITITPSGHQNVTDSFVQVGEMFAERAKAIDASE